MSFLEQPKFSVLLLIIFAGAALALASVGIYAAWLHCGVPQHAREIAMRMAVGRPSSVLRLVLGQATAVAIRHRLPLSQRPGGPARTQ